jgi:hypothetical protein
MEQFDNEAMKQFGNEVGESLKPRKPKFGRLFVILIIALLLSRAVYYYLNAYCYFPILYSVGEVDPRFNVNKEQVIEIAKDASDRWNQAVGKEIIKYDPEASLKITFVYDQRQADLDRLNAELEKIGNNDLNLENFLTKIEDLNDQYETDIEDYTTRLQAYNKKVDYYNNSGGAPTDIYNQLQTESAGFDREKTSLDQRREELIELSTLYDSQVGEFNNDLEKINQYLKENENKLVTQGLYYSGENKIDIFTFGDEEELRLLLMHELAHAVGIEHSENDQAVMSPILNSEMKTDPKPTSDDLELIKNRCQLNFLTCPI